MTPVKKAAAGRSGRAERKGAVERSFRASLEPDGTALNWTIARVPFDIHAAWSKLHRLRVRGEIEGVPFRTSLFSCPDGRGHFVLVNRKMQSAAGVHMGATARFLLAPDLEDRPCDLPPELLAAFGRDRKLLRWTETLPASMRREIGKWVNDPVNPDAKARRAMQMAERLAAAMHGEREPPPILARVFAHNSLASEGWKAMTESQRRGHLLGIFYYGTPEARERRAAKAVADAVKRARQRGQSGGHLAEDEENG